MGKARARKKEEKNKLPYLQTKATRVIRSPIAETRVSESNVLGVEEVYTAVSLIAKTIAKLPWQIFQEKKNGESVLAKKHPLYYLLDLEPNPYTTAYEFKHWLACDYVAYNTGVAIVIKTDGKITSLWQQSRLKLRVKESVGAGEELSFYLTLPNGANIIVDYKDLFLVKNFYNDGVLGNSLLDVAKDTLEAAKSTTKYARLFFEKGVSPDGFIEWSSEISNSDTNKIAREELEKDFKEKHQSLGKFHQTILLPNGAKWVQVQSDMSKTQAVETRVANQKIIGSFMTVVPMFFGDTSGSWADQNTTFTQYAISPIVENIQNAVNARLIGREDYEKGYRLKIDISKLDQGDILKTVQAWVSAYVNGLAGHKEARKQIGLSSTADDSFSQNSAMQSVDHTIGVSSSNETTKENQIQEGDFNK